MKRLGLALILLGLVLTGVSALLFGGSIYRAFNSRQVAAIPIEAGGDVQSDAMTLDRSRLAQVSLALDVQSDSVQEETQFDEREYNLRYRFPLKVEVFDEAGELVHGESVVADWDGGFRSTSSSHVTDQGGRIVVRHHFGKFEPPATGVIRVHAELGEDTVYDARAESAQVIVYDNVTQQGPWVFGAFAGCCSGPLLVVVGAVLLFVGLVSGNKR